MTGISSPWHDRPTNGFFGIRGVSSFYSLPDSLNHIDDVQHAARLWAIIGLVVLISIIMHGLSVTPIMRTLDRLQGRNPDAEDAVPPPGFQGPGGDAP